MNFGNQSMTGPIRRIIIKHPREAFISQEFLETHWKALNFTSCPDYNKTLREFEGFERIIKEHVPEVLYLPCNETLLPDSQYTHDPVKFTAAGAVLMKMGKPQRILEPGAYRRFLQEHNIAVLGAIKGTGRMEGGDILWLDHNTAAVAIGYRTNEEGIRQFKSITKKLIKEIIPVPLPHADGASECLHLMSLISMIDRDLAVVYSRYMPVFFRQLLFRRGIELIEVDDAEYLTLGCNILTLSPRKCIMLSGNPKTLKKLEAAGVDVHLYQGEHLSLKGTGGPACLTCPVSRI